MRYNLKDLHSFSQLLYQGTLKYSKKLITFLIENPKFRNNILRAIVVLLVIIWIVYFYLYNFFSFPTKIPEVVTYFVQSEIVPVTVEAIGKTEASKSIYITSRNNGYVDTLEFEEGSFVKKGTILASLRKNQETANYNSIRVQWQNALINMRRQQDLFEKNLISKSALENSKTLEEQLRNDAQSAQSKLADQLITAPFSGLVGIRKVGLGSFIQAGQTITTLDDTDELFVNFSLPATLTNLLQKDLVIEASLTNSLENQNSKKFQGKLFAIDSRVDVDTQSIFIRAIISNSERNLRPGVLMYVTVQLSSHRGFVIPEEALVQKLDKSSVWVVNVTKPIVKTENIFSKLTSLFSKTPEKKIFIVEKKQITIISRKAGWVEIEGDIQENDLVVIRGINKFKFDPKASIKNIVDKNAYNKMLLSIQ
ncbi:MAG: efflux RND transporter periplasmic adaptor subunit [Methylacidiphilales bacterium]|nr:efflux RND transporter periplasmic adaptor subunit [Candidatus Methylacidiphilales bacterium]